MNIPDGILKREEEILFALRRLYRLFGYTQYKMRKFEEYDLYAGNRDFLVSSGIITFQDTDGKLLALKPDVTLSIIRSGRDEPGAVQKVCYQENVYRVAGYSGAFREIMQAGIECIGAVDVTQLAEVLELAAESLRVISGDSVLAVAHLDALNRLMEEAGLSPDDRKTALSFVRRKSLHELQALCAQRAENGEAAERLVRLAGLSDTPEKALEAMEALGCAKEAGELRQVLAALDKTEVRGAVRIDFSAVNDPGYYNGLVFQGYAGGIPERVIAGGQYDRLMRKMGRTARAAGFAVYLDTLERLEDQPMQDADVLLLYPEEADGEKALEAARKLRRRGLSVSLMREKPENRRFGRTAVLAGQGEVRYEP